MKKMTAAGLGIRIHKGLKKHSLVLKHIGYYNKEEGAVCAIGGALAYAAKSRKELEEFLVSFHSNPDGGLAPGHRLARVAAKILNHKLEPRDMVLLEMGYEGMDLSDMIRHGDARREDAQTFPNKQNPFFKLGKKLREESLKAKKAA